MVRLRWFQPRVRRSSNRAVQGKFQSVLICRTERKKAAEIVSGPSGKNTCLMKSSPLPRMLLQSMAEGCAEVESKSEFRRTEQL